MSVGTECVNRLKTVARLFWGIAGVLLAVETFATERTLTLQEGVKTKSSIEVYNGASIGVQTYAVTVKVEAGRKACIHVKMMEDVPSYAGGGHTECGFPGKRIIYMSKESSYTSYSWEDFLYDHVYFNFFRTYYTDVTFKVGAYWSFGTGITQGLEIEVEYESAYFNVTFSNNGGDGYMFPQQLCEGVAARLQANTLTREGYAFKGWAESPFATEPDYPDGASVTLWGATTLYAVWEKIYGDASDKQVDASQTVRVTFDPGRGTLEKNSRLYYRNAQYGDLPSPSISDMHYRFFGWERSAEGPLLLSTDRVNSDCTLQAHIERVKFDIRFEPCGGVVSPTVMTYDRNSTYGTAFPAVSRTGYSFAGWFSAEGEAGIAYRSSDRCLADGVMYAHWNPNRYEVVLSDNGGSGGLESVVGTYAAILPSVAVPERDGYEFDGYWSAKEGGDRYVDEKGIGCRSFDFAEGGRTLYAHWNARTYSLSLEPSGGAGGSTTGMARFGGNPFPVAVPKRAGYVFTGYYTAADGGTRYYDENGDGTAVYEQAKPATLYAHWAEEVAVTYHANWVNGDVDFGNLPRTFETFGIGLTYGTLPTLVRDGFVFDGWYSSPTGGARIDNNSVVTADRLHLYAHWRALDNTIVVEKRADETSCAVSLWHSSTYLAYISLVDYEWLSFSSLVMGSSIRVLSGKSRTFNNGWFGEGRLGLEMSVNETGRTRYAYFPVWVGSSGGAIDYHVVIVQAGKWTLTLDGNGGAVSPTTLTVESGYPFGLLPEATRTGWSFDGWQTEGDNHMVVSDDSLVAVGTMRLVARWASVSPRTLVLDAAGGSGGSTSVSVVHGAYPTDVTPPARTGYAFAGYRAPNGVAYYDGKGKAIRPWDLQDVDALYAIWVPKTMTIVLDKGEGERESISAAYGELMPTVGRPIRTDADFDGYWSESGVRYYSKTAQPERVCDFETTATLYAKWRPVVKTSALYCVIDISAGEDAKSYPVSYLDAPPAGGWTDRHKTDCIVLRRIDPGTFEMGLPRDWAPSLSQVLSWGSLRHSVTITKPYYIGVFEVTQRQWELVMGTRPSYFENDSCYAKRPVENVSYNMIRDSGMWPKYGYVGEDGFLYRLRVRTGMGGLDLPTNAQWEMACRAGNSYDPPSGRNSGNSGASSDLCDVTCTTTYGTAEVGSYLPNAWGLYDMLGNVEEWCLDRGWSSGEDPQTDPVGLPYTDKAPSRCLRGGDFRVPTREAAYINETFCFTADKGRGFRLALQTAQLADNSDPKVTVSFLSGDGKRIVSEVAYQVGEAYGALPNLPVRMGYVGKGWSATQNGGAIVRADELVTLTRTNLFACWKTTIRTPPNAPIGLKAGCGMSTEAIRLTWDPVNGADGYNIYRGNCLQADSAVKIATVSANSYEDCETLSPGVDYFYWVESFNVIGRSKKGACAIGWVALEPPLVNVESVSAAGVSLAWENVSGCNCYRIYRATAPDGVKVALGADWQSERTFVDTTCEPGMEYLYYVVAAKNCFGDRPSDYSMAVRATRVASMRVTVRYGANDGSSACQQMSQKAGMAGIEPQIPTRVGYDFLGWSRSPTAQTPEFPMGGAVVVSSDCDLYAVWREVIEPPPVEPTDPEQPAEPPSVPFDYEVGFGSVWINCYTGTDTDVVIPSEIEGLPVVRIDGFRPEGAESFNVKSVTLPDSLKGISDFAFYGCDKLTAIRIPASVSYVSDPYLAFYGCDALQSIEVDNGNSEYKSENGCLLSKDGRILLLAPPGRQKLEIPNGVKVLAANACSNQKVTFISIPEGVEELDFGVFAEASSLEQVEFPMTVVKLGDCVFWKAVALKSVTFRGNAPAYGKDIYYDTSAELVTLVSPGSTGWARSGSTALPESWPTGDDHARAIRHAGNWPEEPVEPAVTNTITYVRLEGAANPNPATFTTNDLPLVLGPVEREGCRFLGWTPNGGVIPAGTVTNVTFVAQWAANAYTVKFNANGGRGVMAGQAFAYDAAQNLTMNGFTRAGCEFLGWAMSSAGEVVYADGASVKNLTATADGVVNLYAVWDVTGLVDPAETHIDTAQGEVAPYAVAATVYDGYLYDGDNVVGSVQVKVAKGKTDKKSGAFSAKVTATVQLTGDSKKVSFKGGVADGSGRVTGLTAAGHTLDISLGVDGMGGTMDGKSVDGARNLFSAKDADSKSIAAAIEKKWVGAVNVVGDDVVLSVAIAKKGKVKVSGIVEGAKVSATSQLLVGAETCCVPVVITKKANLAFNLWLMADGTVEVHGADSETSGEDAASPLWEAGKAGTLNAGAKFRMDGVVLSRALTGLYGEYLPNDVGVTQSGTKWVVAGGVKAGKLALVKGTSEIDSAKSKFTENMSGLKLTYKAKDGSFKGSFKVYNLENGKIKAYTANVTGVMIGNTGYGTATIKKPFVSLSVAIE